MNERNYNLLWEFAKQHRDYHSANPNEPQTVSILYLYQEEAVIPLNLSSAADVEEACHCIRMALQYAL